MVAAKKSEASKKLLDSIVLGNKSNFVNTRFIL
jgi:glyceraldehyde-3-phosphate dehydrogenase (NADP+)